ncbi:hypothetical protein C5167_046728 [Papaver somniferum]|uniref:Uncharacterized protein n=1 Tax=Papaver somniferum TaxID=3469 RepID=A0A4Y7LI52_PAPSO|nr:hypothetical protein C5167_046728 [Papaver somniferum]
MEGKDMKITRCDKIGSSRQDCCTDMTSTGRNLGEATSSNFDYGVGVEVMYDVVYVAGVMDIGSNKLYVSKDSIKVASAVGDFGCPPFHAIKNNHLY